MRRPDPDSPCISDAGKNTRCRNANYNSRKSRRNETQKIVHIYTKALSIRPGPQKAQSTLRPRPPRTDTSTRCCWSFIIVGRCVPLRARQRAISLGTVALSAKECAWAALHTVKRARWLGLPPPPCRWRCARGRDTQRGAASRVEDLLEHLAAAYTKLNLTHIGS